MAIQISVVIPVLNGGVAFGRCLSALWQSDFADWECVVVDDGSTDGSAEMARKIGATVVSTERPQSGPAVARNLGVKSARGGILFFIDADVLVKADTLTRISRLMENADEYAACIGSYDTRPLETNFLSQYRNLLHHFTHQKANEEAATFWSGCGAIRHKVFSELGGFNPDFSRPSIEDIELGYRLKASGYRIILDKQLQVGHMKRWTAVNMLVTDIRDRAIPWARLILSGGVILNDLNLTISQRVSSAVVLLGVTGLILSLFFSETLIGVGLVILLLLVMNRAFYCFLLTKRGLIFMLQSLPWHWLYFIYSGLSFAVCYLWYRVLHLGGGANSNN